MIHDEPWQVFAQNGEAVPGKSASRSDFELNRNLIMGAAHIWVWRRKGATIEVLLQQRARDKKTWPGYLDVSAAGHIDASETPVRSAVREAKEEIGLTISPEALYYIFAMRAPLDLREIDTVYLYELNEHVEFNFNDGEVERLDWVELEKFQQMTTAPDEYSLVPQGNEYFALLIRELRVAIKP